MDDPSLLIFSLASVVCLSSQAQRLVFDQSSPNGILLFRECSKIAVAFGTRLLQVMTSVLLLVLGSELLKVS